MTHTNRTNSFYSYLLIFLLLLAVALRGGADFEWLKPSDVPVYSLSDIQQVFPGADSFKKQSDNSQAIYNSNNKHLGYVLISEELDARFQGYGGAVPLLIALDLDKRIISTQLLKHNETTEFIDHVNDEKLLNTWDKLPMDTTILYVEVDAVSGATKSSRAIIRTFQSSAGNYLQAEQQYGAISLLRIVQLVLLVILLGLSLSMMLAKRFRRFYIYYLVGVVLVMGLWLKKMLSIELLQNWLTKGLPWQSNWELIVILSISVVLAIAGHKKYYCTYLCPMGAVQMLVSKASPFKKRNLKLKISVLTLRNIYLTFIWVSLILGFALPLSNLEPFIAFSFKVASWIMLSAGGVIILLSLFFNRPWCQLCPTGCLLDSIPSVKSNRK
ncbi:MAG: FMN-binding protein [Bacteroidales bacterium]|nr:FMN-binding protein [Bacteroidales bacterium]